MNVMRWIEGSKVQYHPQWLRRWREDPFNLMPVYLEISPSGRCNHRCSFCAPDILGYPDRFLDTDIMCRRIGELRELREEDPDGLGVKSIQFAGEGEPTLHKELGRIFKATRDAGIDIGMLTNGTALPEQTARRIIPLVNGYIQFSVNAGTAKSYARIHDCSEQHWNMAWRNIERAANLKQTLGARDCELGVNMTVLVQEASKNGKVIPANWQEIEQLVQRAHASGADYVSIKPYSQHPLSQATAGRYGTMSYRQLMDEINATGEDLIRRYSSDLFEVVFRFTRFEEYESERPYSTCLVTPSLWSYIQSDGLWLSCSAYWTDPRFALGNLNTQTVREIWFGETRRQHLDFVLNHLDIGQCRKTCHPDKDNKFMTGLRGLSDEEFEKEMVQLETVSPPKRANFI